MALAGPVMLLGALSGCSSESETTSDSPWAAEFDQAMQDARTDLQREILEDYVVTDAEYAELQSLQKQCIEGLGLEVSVLDTGGFSVIGELTEQQWTDVDECDYTTVYPVEHLFWGTRNNPENRDQGELVKGCLRSHGIDVADIPDSEIELAAFDGLIDGDQTVIEQCLFDPEGSK